MDNSSYTDIKQKLNDLQYASIMQKLSDLSFQAIGKNELKLDVPPPDITELEVIEGIIISALNVV
jgi:hypothetical protein